MNSEVALEVNMRRFWLPAFNLSFLKRPLTTPRKWSQGAEVPSSLETSEPGPHAPCHCTVWPRLSQMDTLPGLEVSP